MGAPPVSDARDETASCCARALDLFAEAGYAIKGQYARQHPRTAYPSPLRLSVPRAIRSGLAWPTAPASNASVSRRWCAPSMPRNRASALRLRFRHDAIPLGPVAVARQRAVVSIGARTPADRTAAAFTWVSNPRPSTPYDCSHAGGHGTRRLRRRVAGAGSRAAVRLLRWYRCIFPRFNGVARWTRIAHPSQTSLFGYLPETWWRCGA